MCSFMLSTCTGRGVGGGAEALDDALPLLGGDRAVKRMDVEEDGVAVPPPQWLVNEPQLLVNEPQLRRNAPQLLRNEP